MNEEQKNTELVKLIQDYSTNEDRIAKLRSSLREIGEHLTWVGGLLTGEPRHVQVAEDGKTFSGHQVHGNRSATLDVALLAITVDALQRAYELKPKMEALLRQNGMDTVIRSR